MNVIITERPALKCIGMQLSTRTDENKIPLLWDSFIIRMPELDDVAVPDCSLGICIHDSIKEYDEFTAFDYLAAKVVKNLDVIPQDMIAYEIPATLVAVFTHQGSLDSLAETYEYIYDEWLPQSGYSLADGDELEWYDARFVYDSEDSQMDIHIPIVLNK